MLLNCKVNKTAALIVSYDLEIIFTSHYPMRSKVGNEDETVQFKIS